MKKGIIYRKVWLVFGFPFFFGLSLVSSLFKSAHILAVYSSNARSVVDHLSEWEEGRTEKNWINY